VVGDEQRRLRREQVGERFAQLVGGKHVFVVEREVGGKDEGDVVVVGDHFGDRAHHLGPCRGADLEGGDRHVLEQHPRLRRDDVGIEAGDFVAGGRVAHCVAGEHGHAVAAHAGKRHQVGLQAGAACRVGQAEAENDRRSVAGHEMADEVWENFGGRCKQTHIAQLSQLCGFILRGAAFFPLAARGRRRRAEPAPDC
jgi:hypothetical protein